MICSWLWMSEIVLNDFLFIINNYLSFYFNIIVNYLLPYSCHEITSVKAEHLYNCSSNCPTLRLKIKYAMQFKKVASTTT